MKDRAYVAWSTDPEVLARADCGGAVTSLLQYALASGYADVVLATAAREGNRYDGIPVFITEPDAVVETAGSLHAAPVNISRNLKEYLDGATNCTVAVVCKPCDAKAIIELVKREQIQRENVLLIGLNCTGTFSPAEARRIAKEEAGVEPGEIVHEDVDSGLLTLTLRDGSTVDLDLRELEAEGLGRRDNCRRCEMSIPSMADLACGKWGVEPGRRATFVEVLTDKGADFWGKAIEAGAVDVDRPTKSGLQKRAEKAAEATQAGKAWQEKDFAVFRGMTLPQRFAYWQMQFQQCIKCFGCRDACPICYCDHCWLEAERGYVHGGEVPPPVLWPMVRTAHVMDSCVNCGQCQDACSMNLPLSLLVFMLNREISGTFHQEPGMDVETRPPLLGATEEEMSVDAVTLTF